MNLAVTSVNISGYVNHSQSKCNSKNPAFKAKTSMRAIRNAGMAIAAVSLLSFSSCTDKYKTLFGKNIESSEIADSENSSLNNGEKYKNSGIKHVYHYFPKNDNYNLRAEDYDWLEIIYPDGKIEKDSLGYKVVITSDGRRTVTNTKTDDKGNQVITIINPDGSKYERVNYKTDNKYERIYTEKTYWPNKKLQTNKYCKERLSDISDENSAKIIEQSVDTCNENGILIKWKSNIKNTEGDKKHNKYDRQKRLIYDDIKKEKYQYKGNSKTPYRSISTKDGCERITLYNKGKIKRIYFKAEDGTITKDN